MPTSEGRRGTRKAAAPPPKSVLEGDGASLNPTPTARNAGGLLCLANLTPSEFVRFKFLWLEQLTLDPDLTPLALRLGCLLAAFLNREDGDAWPSQPLLAELLRIKSEEAIRMRGKELEARGHLDLTPGRGKGVSSRYRPILKPQHRVGVIDHLKAQRRPGVLTRPKTPTNGGR
jgi:hypothetical protein